MKDFRLSVLGIWRRVIQLGYPCLESVLSTIDLADEYVITIDPSDGDLEEMRLADTLAAKFSKVRVVDFCWPKDVPGDGSRIGIASQYGLQQCRGDYVLNVQADECWPVPLMEWTRDNWREVAQQGYEGLRFKVLHTEFNAQQFQGGNETSTWEWQSGAGYNKSIKLFKRCPAIKFSHDGWSVDGVAMLAHAAISEVYPIVHLHDFHRDSYIALRKNAAMEIWTDKTRFGHYKASADHVEQTRDEWYNDKKWERTTSPFEYLLPPFAKRLLGKTSYKVDYSLLDEYEAQHDI